MAWQAASLSRVRILISPSKNTYIERQDKMTKREFSLIVASISKDVTINILSRPIAEEEKKHGKK